MGYATTFNNIANLTFSIIPNHFNLRLNNAEVVKVRGTIYSLGKGESYFDEDYNMRITVYENCKILDEHNKVLFVSGCLIVPEELQSEFDPGKSGAFFFLKGPTKGKQTPTIEGEPFLYLVKYYHPQYCIDAYDKVVEGIKSLNFKLFWKIVKSIVNGFLVPTVSVPFCIFLIGFLGILMGIIILLVSVGYFLYYIARPLDLNIKANKMILMEEEKQFAPVEKQQPVMQIEDKSEINCPFCGGLIKTIAKKCRHCKEWVNPEPA